MEITFTNVLTGEESVMEQEEQKDGSILLTVPKSGSVKDPTDIIFQAMNIMSSIIHNQNVSMGWWTDLDTGMKKERNVGELLCLVHSEISEAMEGHRKGLMDDKLPHRSMFEVELADAIIRILDIAGAHNLDLSGAMLEKINYNSKREDHKLENRIKDGGKKY